MRSVRWHSRWGIQPPLPWVLAGIAAGPAVILTAGALLLCWGSDDVLHYIFESEPY